MNEALLGKVAGFTWDIQIHTTKSGPKTPKHTTRKPTNQQSSSNQLTTPSLPTMLTANTNHHPY
jgi:hypothetical protein